MREREREIEGKIRLDPLGLRQVTSGDLVLLQRGQTMETSVENYEIERMRDDGDGEKSKKAIYCSSNAVLISCIFKLKTFHYDHILKCHDQLFRQIDTCH